MSESANLAKLKQAYAAWHETKGASRENWLALFADQVEIASVGQPQPGLAFAQNCCSRDEALGYFTGLLETWDMIHWTPATFVDGGSNIAMFGRCAWRNKATGKEIDVAIAHLWTFEGEVAVKIEEVFDSARVMMAAS